MFHGKDRRYHQIDTYYNRRSGDRLSAAPLDTRKEEESDDSFVDTLVTGAIIGSALFSGDSNAADSCGSGGSNGDSGFSGGGGEFSGGGSSGDFGGGGGSFD